MNLLCNILEIGGYVVSVVFLLAIVGGMMRDGDGWLDYLYSLAVVVLGPALVLGLLMLLCHAPSGRPW